MREIKYRIWDPELDNGRMLYFDNFEEIVDWQNWDEWKLENSPMRSVDYMQYTGLKDKNGKEIYEGDIVRCLDSYGDYCYNSKIDYEGGTFSVEVNGCDYDYTALGWALENEDIREIEVIGNIHENPELLEGDKE